MTREPHQKVYWVGQDCYSDLFSSLFNEEKTIKNTARFVFSLYLSARCLKQKHKKKNNTLTAHKRIRDVFFFKIKLFSLIYFNIYTHKLERETLINTSLINTYLFIY